MRKIRIENPEQFGVIKTKKDNTKYCLYKIDVEGNESLLATIYDDKSYTLYSRIKYQPYHITYVGKYGVMANTVKY